MSGCCISPQALVSGLAGQVAKGYRVERSDVEALLGSGADLRSLARALERLEGEAAEHARRVVADVAAAR